MPKKPVQYFWALYDSLGELFSAGYKTPEEADDDAVGPRFYCGYTVRCYELVTRKREPRKAEREKMLKEGR